ncbi:MAG: DNA repair protein RadA [Bacillota bacterium]|nr:DNA repair protein RadA [Bacillota bacterium]
MAKKVKTVFVCQECGYESTKWMGQCICGAWNSMVEEKIVETDENDRWRRVAGGGKGNSGGAGAPGGTSGRAGRPSRLLDVSSEESARIDTGIGELNRVLGGGLVPGSLTLISGEPGIGKSTIIIQAAARIANSTGAVLYVSGEESEEQIRMRADRVCGDLSERLFILAETNMENISAVCQSISPAFLIVDSIQTMYTADLESAPGSVSQVRSCGGELMRIGKSFGIPVFIVAHVTKSGDLAGPRILEHMVDCVLSFSGDRTHEMRILRANKNRFGTTSEIGAFEMNSRGLMEIENLSGLLMEEMDRESDGAVATAVYEGTRPLILEVQALTSPCGVGFPRRTALGIDTARLNMILAVLEKKMGLQLSDQDVYVNIVGGLRPEGTYTDLAVAAAVISSCLGSPLDSKTLVLGEIGLTGDLRSIQNAEKIVREADRLGFCRVILPERNVRHLREIPPHIRLHGIRSIGELRPLFG